MRDCPNRRGEIAGCVEMMAQACWSDRREIRINRQDFPQVCVRSVFEKLERKHMVYVLKCMAEISPKVRNIPRLRPFHTVQFLPHFPAWPAFGEKPQKSAETLQKLA